MDSMEFRAGFAHLAPLGLCFEASVSFYELPQLTALARAFPDARIVVNHCGGVIGGAKSATHRDEVFRHWRRGLIELAVCPNVMVKLSGLGTRLGRFRFEDEAGGPTSVELANAWHPWIETCLAAFGPDRSMYGSNFPVDKGSHSYTVGLNALKLVVADATSREKADIFWRSATRFYRLSDASVRIPDPESPP
jgi:predicted TIM-barrel fold metal-dependent hydrolase